MLHLSSSKSSRDVLGTGGQSPFGCARNSLMADTNTSKQNMTYHLGTISGRNRDHINPIGEGKPLSHSPHARTEGIAHKVRRARVLEKMMEGIHSP